VLKFIKIIKRDTRLLTDEQISLLNNIYERIEAGSFPKKTIKDLKQKLSDIFETSDINDTSKLSLKLFETLKNNTPSDLLKPHISETSANIDGPREVILSMYLS